MTTADRDDPLLRRLRHLPIDEPDQARLEGTRARCRVTLARQQKRRQRLHHARITPFIVEAAILGGFSVAYLLAIVDLLQPLWRN